MGLTGEHHQAEPCGRGLSPINLCGTGDVFSTDTVGADVKNNGTREAEVESQTSEFRTWFPGAGCRAVSKLLNLSVLAQPRGADTRTASV